MTKFSLIGLLTFAILVVSQITLNLPQELYIVQVQQCQISSMYMNFSFISDPSTVDFLVYPSEELSNCDPSNIVYQYPHSASINYYSQFSCIGSSINTNHCNITRTSAIQTGPTCFAFYNRYYKGPVTISYYLTVNCSQSAIQLQTISVTPGSIQGPGNNS